MSQGIADHTLDEIGVIQVARVYGQNGDSQFLCELINGVLLAVLFRDINHGRNCNNRVPCLSDLPQQVQRTRHCACIKQNNGKIDFASSPRISEGPRCTAESIADDLLVGRGSNQGVRSGKVNEVGTKCLPDATLHFNGGAGGVDNVLARTGNCVEKSRFSNVRISDQDNGRFPAARTRRVEYGDLRCG